MEGQIKHHLSSSKKNRKFRLDASDREDDPEASHSLLRPSNHELTNKKNFTNDHENLFDGTNPENDEINLAAPLLKSILKESKLQKSMSDEKSDMISPKHMSCTLTIPSDQLHKASGNNVTRIDDYAFETRERASRIVQRKQKPEPVKAFVHFRETEVDHLQPTAGPSGHSFRQRASFQSETRNLASCSQNTATLEHKSGVICSNNDLHLILREANQLRRNSTEVRRERVKNARSLSFDSSIFRFRKGSLIDSSIWFSKNSSPTHQQNDRTDSPQKNIIQIRVTANSPESDMDEMQFIDAKYNSEIKTLPENALLTENDSESSKVTWDEESVVDASVLGNAIESYLNSGEKRSSAEQTKDSKRIEELTVPESSIYSTFKSLFVK